MKGDIGENPVNLTRLGLIFIGCANCFSYAPPCRSNDFVVVHPKTAAQWQALNHRRVGATRVFFSMARGLLPICANQNQKDLFSAFGTLILERLATAGAFLS